MHAGGAENLPTLVEPIMVAAFEGWNDAGEAASGVIEHLCESWDANLLAELDPEDYYDYQVNRPLISLDEQGVRHLTWPTTRLYVARLPLATRDVVLVHGVEPNMRWQQFTREVLDLATALRVEMVIALGALLSDNPHTRPVPVTGACADPELSRRLDIAPTRYEGPTGIVGVLQDACGRAGIPAVSLWAAVPHYAAAPPSPKATLALLQRLEDILDVSVPSGDLPEAVEQWQAGIDEMVEEDDDFAGHVRDLEEARDVELPDVSGEAIAREFERYLRRQGGEDR
jgi:proteasome assembly chaperone (PAC2) family protein